MASGLCYEGPMPRRDAPGHRFTAFYAGAFAALVTVGCIPVDGGGGGGSGNSGGGGDPDGGDGGATTAAGRACLDTADAYAQVSARCGDDYAASRTRFIRELAGGDCESVSIRNERELRGGCFPSLARITCSDFLNGRLDPTCAEQILD